MRRTVLSTLPFACLAIACGSSDEDPTSDEPTMEDPTSMEDPGETGGEDGLALDECGLATDFIGDEYCILPPPDGEGFQIHYGPTDYDNPDEVAPYLLEPGGESNLYEPMAASNTTDVYFYKRQYRMRPGSHHLIVSESGGTGGGIAGLGRRLGGSQNVAKDNPTAMAPENEGMGMPLSANAQLSVNLHHFNGTAESILREAWVNFWYVDDAEVTQEAKEMFLWVQGPAVDPGASAAVVGQWDIAAEGRVLTMYGHRHSNTTRFSAYRVRDGERELIYDDYDWLEPSVFEFNSVTENPSPDGVAAGAYTGVMELKVGDALEWQCDIVNERDVAITFGENEAETSEMCILVGDAVGPELLGFTF